MPGDPKGKNGGESEQDAARWGTARAGERHARSNPARVA
jgi:hypothetical protein